MPTLFEQVRANKIKSGALFAIFIILVGIIGSLFGVYYGSTYFGLGFSLIAAMVYFIIVYFSGDSIILSISGAKPVTKNEYPHLWHAIDGLSVAAGIPKPKAYVIEDSALNAFATGRNPEHASIAVTTGLLKVMNRQELEGVIAHEISHIRNDDIRLMMLATVLVGIVTLIGDIFLRSLWFRNDDRRNSPAIFILIGVVLAIFAPIAAQLIQLAISRQREFLADASAAVITRYPPGLAGALQKIAKDPDPLVDHANRATAHLFISTPFRKTRGVVTHLFSTHPPIEERIKRLKAM
ncbi:M48 family metalloprotease [Candidatus Woesearchaeota archaeon]|nr:M48 family metalloprotease [Candidatus Woesearchaeota archaeon]